MPLKHLSIWNTKVIDLTPLKGMAIQELDLSGTKVADLTPLRGMPLTWLSLDRCGDVTDLSPLADCTTLTRLHLPPYARHVEFLRSFPKLREISSKTAAEFWQDYDKQVWARALRESGLRIKTLKGHLDGTWEVDLSESAISDLAILHGAPISNLFLWNTPVADLTPLRGMTLKWLSLFGTKVGDLGPLKGMPLENLTVSGTKVADISALRGMPLKSLRLHDCTELTDLSPLAECVELRDVTLPPNAKNIEFLRTLPNLERIGFKEDASDSYRPNKTAAEFWAEYDATKK
jgi:Leucine-rich repeat (LRR) protein